MTANPVAPVLAEGFDYHIIAGAAMLTIDGKVKLLAAAGYALSSETLPGYRVKITLAHWRKEVIHRGWLALEEVPMRERSHQQWKTHPTQMLRARAISKLFDDILREDPDLLTLAEACLASALPTAQVKKS